MSGAYQLLTLHSGVADLRMLFQHQSQATQEAFAEALHHWSDPLGQRFVAAHLDPQTRLLGPTRDALAQLTRALESAAGHGEKAESHLVQARLAADDMQQAAAECVRLGGRARQLAALARSRRQDAESRARDIRSGLNALGTPPT
jgi:hypothetical protein